MLGALGPLIISLLVQWFGVFTDPLLREPPGIVEAPERAPFQEGKATRFGGQHDSQWGGQALACAPDYHTDESMFVCAHRQLPCGTVILIESVRTKKTSLCRVMDRGPFGAKGDDGVWFPKVGRHKQRTGVFRGILDMTPAVVHALGLTGGLAQVRIWRVWVPKKPMRIRVKRRDRPRPST